jgi:glycogen debranching enzyme
LDISSYEITKDPDTLRGLDGKLVDIPEVVPPQGLDNEGPFTDIIVPEYFPPGSIMIFETQTQGHDAELDLLCKSGVTEAFSELSLVDLNVVLYRADGEERDATSGVYGVYDVPGMGKTTYCGLEGWMHPLKHIMRHNDLGHPLCGHLREGSWALDYIVARLEESVFLYMRSSVSLAFSPLVKRRLSLLLSHQLSGSRRGLTASRMVSRLS